MVARRLVARAALADAQTLPKPTSKVSDFAGVLTPTARADLESLLTTLEKDTTAEVVVATTASLGGMSVEEYGNRVFNEWQTGKAALDNGVLVLVAPTERQIRIEVGYGLEGVIPDGLAGAIIRDDFLPDFRDGNYEAGILTGVRRVAAVVRAKQVLTPEQLAALSRRRLARTCSSGSCLPSWRDVAGRSRDGGSHVRPGVERSLRFEPGVRDVVPSHLRRPADLFLARTAFLLVPVALAGGVWGYRRRPLSAAVSGSMSSSGWDWSVSTGSSGSDSGSSSSDSSEHAAAASSGGGGASGSW